MSTNINITVGDNALLDAAKANQAANRQAQLEKEANQRLAAAATDARTEANAAAGKDADGNLLYGVPTAKPDIERRPAANRQSTYNYGEADYRIYSGENDKKIVSIVSVDRTASLVYEIPGSEIPEGYRDRDGADRLPYLNNPYSSDLPYLSVTQQSQLIFDRPESSFDVFKITDTIVEHTGINGNDPPGEVNAWTSASGGWSRFFTIPYEDLVFLPIGKDLVLLVVLTFRYSAKSYSLRTRISEYEQDNLTSINTLISYESTTTIELEEHVQSEQTSAFLIGKSSIKQVQCPNAFVEILKSRNFWVVPDLGPVQRTGTKTEYVGPLIPNQEYTFTGITYVYSQSYSDKSAIKSNMAATWGFVGTWGIPNTNDLRTAISPGVYDIFRSNLNEVAFPWLLDEIKSNIAEVGKNYKWLRIFETYPPIDKRKLQEYRGILPYNYWDYSFEEEFFKTVKIIPQYPPLTDPYFFRIFFIDWNKPGYCRQQALALGFTAADLTP